MLELRDIRVSYGRTEVVHGVDISVDRGEAVGMIEGRGCIDILRIEGPRQPEI